jgi:hypothetical protein
MPVPPASAGNDRSGSFAPFWPCLDVRFALNNDRMADIRKRSKCAKSCREQVQQCAALVPGIIDPRNVL